MQLALTAIHKAQSLGEIEVFLTKALAESFNLIWVRIVFLSQNIILNQLVELKNSHAVLEIPILNDQGPVATACFGRNLEEPFSQSENHFLQQVTEAVSLALDRFHKMEEAEALKQQWEATFEAISDPIFLTGDDFKVIQANRAFLDKTKKSLKSILGQNGFKIFFKKEVEPKESFQVTENGFVYEVTCQKIHLQERWKYENIFFIFFKRHYSQEANGA